VTVSCTARRPTIPPHVEYTLTPMGREVAGRLVALIEHRESLVPAVIAGPGPL
jgi:DNA-binding HxlR family transcriptional regulator